MILIKSLIVSVLEVLLGWRPVLSSNMQIEPLRAVIEVKSPRARGGFDRQALRKAALRSRFGHLMSGGYDLLVVVKGSTLHQVASFVSERLATLVVFFPPQRTLCSVPTRNRDIYWLMAIPRTFVLLSVLRSQSLPKLYGPGPTTVWPSMFILTFEIRDLLCHRCQMPDAISSSKGA